jgi:putative flippase GtrA
MTIVNTITKNVIKRAWTDLEPKLLAFLATGLTGTLIVGAADYVGVHIDPTLAVAVATVVATIAGYLKSSTTKVPAFVPPTDVAPVTAVGVPVAGE